jgi:hypothetical protein
VASLPDPEQVETRVELDDYLRGSFEFNSLHDDQCKEYYPEAQSAKEISVGVGLQDKMDVILTVAKDWQNKGIVSPQTTGTFVFWSTELGDAVYITSDGRILAVSHCPLFNLGQIRRLESEILTGLNLIVAADPTLDLNLYHAARCTVAKVYASEGNAYTMLSFPIAISGTWSEHGDATGKLTVPEGSLNGAALRLCGEKGDPLYGTLTVNGVETDVPGKPNSDRSAFDAVLNITGLVGNGSYSYAMNLIQGMWWSGNYWASFEVAMEDAQVPASALCDGGAVDKSLTIPIEDLELPR